MRRATMAVAIAAASMAALLPGGAQAATAAPAWSIEAVPYPSAFVPGTEDSGAGPQGIGPGFLVRAWNVGAEPTAGTFTLTDTLPKGLLPATALAPTGRYGPQVGGSGSPSLPMTCSTLGRKITCTGGAEGPLGPGEAVSVLVPVTVEASAKAPLLDLAKVEGGAATTPAEAQTPTPVSAIPSPFGLIEGPGISGAATDEGGAAQVQAGSHPYRSTVAAMNLATDPNPAAPADETLLAAGGGLREAVVSLPHGTVIDPEATPRCKESELVDGNVGCPDDTQVGTVALAVSLNTALGTGATVQDLYNMVPPPGAAAELAFEVVSGTYVHLLGHVSGDGSFTLTADAREVLAKVPVGSVRTTLWGDPTAESHDAQRGACLTNGPGLCPVTRTGKAFVTMPTSCGQPLTTTAALSSWLGDTDQGSYSEAAMEGCASLAFEPTITAKATTGAGESPSGLDFDLHQTFHEGYDELATADLEDATVTLPEGTVLNPSAAVGREACTAAQVGLASAPGASPIRYAESPANCPDASKLGTVEVTTPLLGEGPEGERTPRVLHGSVYLATPFANPFDSLLAIYLVVEDEETGIIAKLAGKVTPDPVTGRLTTSFSESPELPLEDVRLHLYDGSRAALTTPISCGTKTTTSTLTPWSAPEAPAASPTDSFQTSTGCYASEAAAPATASFSAGTTSPLAGTYSPFVLDVSRPDATQHITGIETTLPEGLLGKLAGVSYCPEAGIDRARAREVPEGGKAEIASPSCPAQSQVGTVTTTAGSGPDPIAVSGHAYLAGPYKGAPLSLVVIVPAVAGPFDLGTVVDRVALHVGEYDTRIDAVADPLPTILDGIPLDVRSIELRLDRPSFTLNPTSCVTSSIGGALTTQAGLKVPLAERFGVTGCQGLGFRPKIAISLKGGTGRTAHPALTAKVTYPKGGAYANISRAQVALPHAEFLDQSNIAQTCTKPVIAAAACPKNTIYGRAKAWSPLLDEPLEGPVYLVGGYGYKLPALVAELKGQIRVLLVGRIDTGASGGIRATFEAVPDAPVSRFVLEMKGGRRYGLLVNSEDICEKKTHKANAVLTAQNGRVARLHPVIADSCGKGKKKGGGGGKR